MNSMSITRFTVFLQFTALCLILLVASGRVIARTTLRTGKRYLFAHDTPSHCVFP